MQADQAEKLFAGMFTINDFKLAAHINGAGLITCCATIRPSAFWVIVTT
jgi:hypothetical protein